MSLNSPSERLRKKNAQQYVISNALITVPFTLLWWQNRKQYAGLVKAPCSMSGSGLSVKSHKL